MAVVLALGAALWLHPVVAAAAIFAVNTGEDGDDGVCDLAHCTLREAVKAANAAEGRDQIVFLVPPVDGSVRIIRPTSPLPALDDPAGVNITGFSQPGSSENTSTGEIDAVLLIEIDGSAAGDGADGFVFAAGTSTITGLVVNRFGGAGVVLGGGSGHLVDHNFIGTDASGMQPAGNGGDGVTVLVPECRLDRNIIAANGGDGIRLDGEASETRMGSNVIGGFTGSPALGNRGNGLHVRTAGNVLGVSFMFRFPLGTIAFSGEAGILLSGDEARENVILGWGIFRNVGDGVRIDDGAADNTVGNGRRRLATSNVVAMNGGSGIYLDESAGRGNELVTFRNFGNGRIPVDLAGGDEDENGITRNDPLDADDGPNALQNAPVLLSAEAPVDGFGARGHVHMIVSGEPGDSLSVFVFEGSECDPTGAGVVSDNPFRSPSLFIGTPADDEFVLDTAMNFAAGRFISAFAVSFLNSNTSEFSNCIEVGSPPTPAPGASGTPTTTATQTPQPSGTPTPTPVQATPTPGGATPTNSPRVRTPTPTADGENPAGDGNCDGRRNAADVVSVVSQLGEGRLECRADVTGDERVDGADLAELLARLFEP